MVADAEKYAKEDEEIARGIEMKNKFESYCFQIKNVHYNEKLRGLFSTEDKKLIQAIGDEGIQWLEINADETADVIELKQKELEAKFNPIIKKAYEATGGTAPTSMEGLFA